MRNMRGKNLTENLCWGWNVPEKLSGQFTIIPKPEGEFRASSLTKPHFGVTSAESSHFPPGKNGGCSAMTNSFTKETARCRGFKFRLGMKKTKIGRFEIVLARGMLFMCRKWSKKSHWTADRWGARQTRSNCSPSRSTYIVTRDTGGSWSLNSWSSFTVNVLQKLTCLTARGGVNYERVPNFEHANRATNCSNRCHMVWKMNSSM